MNLQKLESSIKASPQAFESWDPPYCGAIDMRITADGTWFYQGSPIGRPELVKLFSSILRLSDGTYYLVTPVEKVKITVDDAPFCAVEMRFEGEGENQNLLFRTNTYDWVKVNDAQALRFARRSGGQLVPYVHLRKGLEARINRSVFYDLVESKQLHSVAEEDWFGFWSSGAFFPMVKKEEIESCV